MYFFGEGIGTMPKVSLCVDAAGVSVCGETLCGGGGYLSRAWLKVSFVSFCIWRPHGCMDCVHLVL